MIYCGKRIKPTPNVKFAEASTSHHGLRPHGTAAKTAIAIEIGQIQSIHLKNIVTKNITVPLPG